MLKSMRNCLQVFLLDWRTDKANDNFKKINRMKKFITLMILSALCLGAKAQLQELQGVYQIPNSDFETWANDDEPGNGWNSFLSATGKLAGLGKSTAPKPSKYESAHDGSYAVQIYSKSVIGKNANGNLTTGIINMGSTTPSNAANYNFTKRGDSSHSLKFAGMPDAAECYAKFTSGGSPNGRLQFIIHGDVNYTDPEASYLKQGLSSDYAKYKVASAAIIISPCKEWTKFTADFTYTGSDVTPNVHYMLASATTNPTPGGSANDYLYLDDVKLIYYHSLTSCTYDGQQVTFDGNDSASVSALYDENKKLDYVKKGVGATVKEAYNKETGVLTITVKGNDYDADSTSVTTYTIQFYNASATLAVNSSAQYGTFCAPFDVTIPAGVQAFTISGIEENGKLTLVEQKNTIPAHIPVIVYSESASGINEVQFGVATSGTATSDYLKGVYADTKAPVGSYVLQNQSGRVGFYQVQEGIQPMVRANRAYLTVPASANVKAFYMDDATAIQTVEELLSGKAEIYDLAGRRQQKLQKGINIVGGKKVLVK